MCASICPKPVGGIAAVAVVPAGAAACGSPADIVSAAEDIPLIEDCSSYDEIVDSRDGIMRVEHQLTIAVPSGYARAHLDEGTLRRWAAAGTFATVCTQSGERLAVGWSERFGGRQPLRLTGIEWSTDKSAHATPAAILTFRSTDCAPSIRI